MASTNCGIGHGVFSKTADCDYTTTSLYIKSNPSQPSIYANQTFRQMVSLGSIFLLPVLIQRIRNFCQPRPVLDLFQQFKRHPEMFN
jgi:hypothetical protein